MKKYTYTFILLPGFTMEGSDMEYYENKIRSTYPGTIIKFIKPTASKVKVSIYNGKKYNSWYDYYTPNCDKEPIINEQHLINNRIRIHKLLNKEIEYHGEPGKVFLAGMSQGCCMALDAGLTFPQKIGGIIGFKGHLIKRTLKDFILKQKVWVCHGVNDKTIFYDFANETYNNLKEKNEDVYLLTQNCNHSMVSGIINQMKSIKEYFPLI
jgi:predicted esterase